MRKSCVAVAHVVLNRSLTPAPAHHSDSEMCRNLRHTCCMPGMPAVLLDTSCRTPTRLSKS